MASVKSRMASFQTTSAPDAFDKTKHENKKLKPRKTSVGDCKKGGDTNAFERNKIKPTRTSSFVGQTKGDGTKTHVSPVQTNSSPITKGEDTKGRIAAFKAASALDAFEKKKHKNGPPRKIVTGARKTLDTKAFGAKLFGKENNAATFKKKQPISLTKTSGPSTGKVIENQLPLKANRLKDWKLLYELSIKYDTYKKQEAHEKTIDTNITNKAKNEEPKLAGPKEDIRGALEACLGGNYSANCDWLDAKWIDAHLQEDSKYACLTFKLGDPKLFKRFDKTCEQDRDRVITKLLTQLIEHPKANLITRLDLSNCLLADRFLELMADQVLKNPTRAFPKLQVLNLETNLLQGQGIESLARVIRDDSAWKYLQVLMLENQKKAMTTNAEEALARAIGTSPSIVVCSLRVRGGLERTIINNTVASNIDDLRQARRHHAAKTGTLKERKRNAMERIFDAVANNTDSKITEIEIVGDQKFMALKPAEKTNAGAAFANNTHVKTIKMVKLGLDDDFAKALGESLKTNTAIEKLILDSNAISGEGIKAIFAGLAKNTSVVELQVRHQSKTMSSADEEALPGLLDPNKTIVKLGVDARNQLAKMRMEQKTNANREHQRKLRAKAKKNGRNISL